MLAKPNRDKGEMDGGEVRRWVQRAIGADIPVDILNYQAWNSGAALVANRYVVGRTVLAGDAAHIFTPTGGFGMNTGLDDTSNLSWKLAALVQGWGGPHLLESYEQERKPIGHRNTGAARYIANCMRVATPAIEDDGPEGEAARREAVNSSYIQNNHFFRDEEVDATGVQLGARYDRSPLIAPDGAAPPENFDEYLPSGVPGGRAPHLWLDDRHDHGSSLFDRLGPCFTLLRVGNSDPDAAPIVRAAKARGIPFAVLDIMVPEAHALYGRKLALIRPDQYIAWRGDAFFPTILMHCPRSRHRVLAICRDCRCFNAHKQLLEGRHGASTSNKPTGGRQRERPPQYLKREENQMFRGNPNRSIVLLAFALAALRLSSAHAEDSVKVGMIMS